MTKFCKNCAFNRYDGNRGHVCGRLGAGQPNPVTGVVIDQWLLSSEERKGGYVWSRLLNLCGREARFFKAKT